MTESTPQKIYMVPDTFIVALDATTTAVGWCLARDGEYIASGVYKPPGKDAWGRISDIWQWTRGLIRDCDADVVAVEEPMGQHGNPRTDRLLGAVLGAILAACAEYNVPCVRIHPMKVKATGYCKDKLWDTGKLISKQDINGDEADAVGTWQAYLVQRREEETR